MIIILYFMFSVYTSNALIGSPTQMFDLLVEASIKRPVAGNQDGSYLTLKSNFGLIFGVIQVRILGSLLFPILTNFGKFCTSKMSHGS
jgi:Na+/proline symporter